MDERRVYTVMPDYPGTYCKVFTPGEYEERCSLDGEWTGHQPISKKLEREFMRWQRRFARGAEFGPYLNPRFNWIRFHKAGMALARCLKTEVGDDARVVYRKPIEDPGHHVSERREILANGALVELPAFWSRPLPREFLDALEAALDAKE